VCAPLLWPTFPFDGTPAERFSHFVALAKDPATKPDLGAADMGSVNLATYDRRAKKIRGANFVYQNSYATARYFLETSRELGLRPTLQIFEPGFLRAALVFLEQGLLTEPLILKFYLGGPEQSFGLPPTLKSLEAYLEMIKDVRCNWFAATLGGDNLPMVPGIVGLGGHVRVGLEDYQYARDGKLGALRMGLRHGAYCLGCCWALMCVLFAVGVMNLFWVAALTGFVLLEKIGPRGAIVARVAGAALVIFGIVVIA